MSDSPEAIAVAANPKTESVYVLEGDATESYPLEFERVTGDGPNLTVRGVHRIHLEVLGIRFLGADYESDAGRELRNLVEDLRETDDVLAVMKRRRDALEADR